MKAKLLAIILPLILSGAQAFASTQAPMKIALLAGFTGVASIPSYHLLHTVRMEAERINAAGGVLGRPVELVLLDDESNAVNTRRLASDARLDDVVAVLGLPWSQFLMAAGPVLQERGIPSVSILATHDDATKAGDRIFRVCFSNGYQGRKLAEYAYRKTGARKALLFVNLQNAYSTDLARVIREVFEKEGGNVVRMVEYIPQKKPEYFKTVLSELPADSYDSVFIPDNQFYILPIMKVFADLGISDKPFFGGDGWNSANLFLEDSRFKPFRLNVVGHWDEAYAGKEHEAFRERFSRRYRSAPQDASALSYDAFHILINAIERSGDGSRDGIARALRETAFQGLTGDIAFDEDGSPIRKPIVIKKVFDGKREAESFR